MRDQKSANPAAQSKWLTDQERATCQQIAARQDEPHRQRAAALLALDSGKTYNQTAAEVGLTMGQLKYCVTAFRSKRLAIFPKPEVMAEPEQTQEIAVESTAAPDDTSAADLTPVADKKKKKKKNKPADDKDKKKKKKPGKKKKDKSKKKDKKKKK